ncbi:hypothetical protein [Streptomyces lomondensis]|uniref:Cysteinyl-tRNA synthetase n=1 Tax=Streptomyces lomondensis TaxID=68229 RepID=A0ABQ2X4T7_9ACTN|nr:hypothetical protein [Streptomyces lomondensis]MCF0077978.1 hypothetical protein [Streptomyces lomondensis]GGW99462.1 hypothetical protein GCM10010383_31690 [Streptomyces lomondensis]
MLRIIDARTGEPVDAAPARRGLTRVEVHAPGSDTTNLRVLLVADLLVRALELGGTPVWATLTGGRRQAELRAGAALLGIRPFEDSPDVGAGLGEAQVVHVAAEGGSASEGVRIAVAPVQRGDAGASVGGAGGTGASAGEPGESDPPHGRSAESGAWIGGSAGSDPPHVRSTEWGLLPHAQPAESDPPEHTDPAVLRLALLSRHHSAPVHLEAAGLDDAGVTLARWRGAVARWARRPSRPVPDDVRGRLRAAWEDDLDVPGVLDVLRHVETDPDLPDGARFETYAYADRLLGLDLTRDLGTPS